MIFKKIFFLIFYIFYFIEAQYFSQSGQDKFLNELIFKNKENLFFVEIGAFDGITGSNVAYFEKYLNWNGLAIEPCPVSYQKLIKNRNCMFLNCCIANNEKVVDFLVFSSEINPNLYQLSGIIDNFDEWKLNWSRNTCYKEDPNYKEEIISISSLKAENIFSSFDIKHIDYLSIDIEGSEFEALKSIDFNKVTIDVMSIESYPAKPLYHDYLEEKGYKCLGMIGYDYIYIHDRVGLNIAENNFGYIA